VTKPNPVTMFEFKSEYELVTGKSTINATLVKLPKDANILDKVVE
jgi:hypothetical protein